MDFIDELLEKYPTEAHKPFVRITNSNFARVHKDTVWSVRAADAIFRKLCEDGFCRKDEVCKVDYTLYARLNGRIEDFEGSRLIGTRYHGLFPYLGHDELARRFGKVPTHTEANATHDIIEDDGENDVEPIPENVVNKAEYLFDLDNPVYNEIRKSLAGIQRISTCYAPENNSYICVKESDRPWILAEGAGFSVKGARLTYRELCKINKSYNSGSWRAKFEHVWNDRFGDHSFEGACWIGDKKFAIL